MLVSNMLSVNNLDKESSPYLKQHQNNPVHWQPWNKEVLAAAKERGKLLIVSIGYSSCHWCHVMEHESFEDSAVAQLMNEHFTPIKVDREERPDVDAYYMDAVQLISGRGGWPLNAIALPDGRPVYAGTYFPKSQWKNILTELANGYYSDTSKFIEYASKLQEGIVAKNALTTQAASAQAVTKEDLVRAAKNLLRSVDERYGGRRGAPKFILPDNWMYLLQISLLEPELREEVKEAITLTLDQIAAGGIYDQIGGGFARYATDEEWKVPHFEKMLYDNAQLLTLYSSAYAAYGHPLYKEVVDQTLVWLNREMKAKGGGYYSALDADSEGEEGKYYVWTEDEVESLLSHNAQLAKDYFGIGKEGRWEHGNSILVRKQSVEKFARKHNLDVEETRSKVAEITAKMLSAREKTHLP